MEKTSKRKITATLLSEEESIAKLNHQTKMVVKHDTVITKHNITCIKKEFKHDRKVELEEVSEGKYKNMKAPKIQAKDGVVIFDQCKVIDQLPGAKFKVLINTEKEAKIVICYLNGKLRQNNIKITVGDLVRLEMSVYDLSTGRITWRF